MVRAGFGYFGNPYESNEIKGSKMNISGGVGYRNKGKFIDLTYVHQLTKDGFYPYQLDQGFYAPTSINGGTGNIMLTVGDKFKPGLSRPGYDKILSTSLSDPRKEGRSSYLKYVKMLQYHLDETI